MVRTNKTCMLCDENSSRWQFYNVDDLPFPIAVDKPRFCDKCSRAVRKANEVVRKLRENIGSRKKICTVHVVHKEISTQTETTVQRTIKTQTLDNVKDPNRFIADLKMIMEQERKTIVSEIRPSVLRPPMGGLLNPDARQQILDINPKKVQEEFKDKAPVLTLILECLLKTAINPNNPKTVKEYKLISDRKIGFLAGMIGKMANRKLSVLAAQTSLALKAFGLSLEAMNGLEFYGITVSGETTRRLHKNEGAEGVSIAHDYNSGDAESDHANTEHDSTMIDKLDFSVDNLDW